MSNVETVQRMYAAFGRGDVPGILEFLAENVDWEYGTTPSHDVPWLQPRKGRGAVVGFFEAIGREIEFHDFRPTVLLEGDGVVVALVDIDASVRKTGKRVAERDEAHIWRFGADGKVSAFRHGVDTHAHVLAWRG